MTDSDDDLTLLLDNTKPNIDTTDDPTYKNTKKKKRNKLCEDINRNVVQERRLSLSRNPFKLRYLWKRKPIIYLLAILLLVFLVNLTINRDVDEHEDDSLYFISNLHSHVPGMKVLKNLTSLLKVKLNKKQDVTTLTPTKIGLTEAQIATAASKKRVDKNLKTKLLKETPTLNSTSLSLSSDFYANSSFSATPLESFNNTLPSPPPTGYLVWSEYCKMPNLDPYLPEVMKNFRREKYKPCKLISPLTRVDFNRTTKRYTLSVDQEVIPAYSKTGKLDCCYQSIVRNGTGEKVDRVVSLSECMSFVDKTSLSPTIDNILVRCRSNNRQVYINGYPLMPERKEIRQRLETWKKYDDQRKRKEKAPSVLMLGIDSISRVNLVRAMPKTAKYLYDNEWFEMSGFNKIDDNTFPNLMAVLTGMNRSTVMQKCSPYKLEALDNCDFIWKTFRDHGYVTAYAEDEASINTFNYLKVGFTQPPVDYYLRPFLLGAEKHLETKLKSSLIDCLGYKHSADFVFDYAVELAKRYKNESYFGLFWANTFSHNDISDCSAMDEHIMNYLKKFKQMGTLEDTIVVFFSDHGMRFGPIRKTHSGHLEERLPFVFLWLPPNLKQNYPSFVNALNVNKNRLTNPYDTHMTLKHILRLTGRVQNETVLNKSDACPKCQSLLEPVPQNRSCLDVAIEAHWCTCLLYESIYKNSKTVVNLTHLLIDYINDYVANFHNGTLAKMCVPLAYDSVESAYRTTQLQMSDDGKSTSTINIYRVTFYTKPNKGLFEATAIYDPVENYLKVTGEISRLNKYSADSECVSDGGAKKYCSCHKKIF
ncbi:hypothetical protein FF38_09154 [Lucilia cuprina]|uniref:DUF229 domain-containing protein n=1 Tax=Lucilia cuprina TaxID=7375 RepID=A0A0L0CQQ8_LUCCU|nr:hypothetical protein CVS40_3650 [Lucilia cuprina]KNC34710.1 hypothetical protein FF38_09154 [Lucilia cuprina]